LSFLFREQQARIDALEKTLAKVDESNPDLAKHLRAEAEIREAYSETRERLERYESIYGSGSQSSTPDLVKRLSDKEEELRSVKELKRQHDEQVGQIVIPSS
jgi:E3 ubiquitin-protein ligase BRE1